MNLVKNDAMKKFDVILQRLLELNENASDDVKIPKEDIQAFMSKLGKTRRTNVVLFTMITIASLFYIVHLVMLLLIYFE